jgi:uncharacterized integral membrane protein (TIGR00697 family)
MYNNLLFLIATLGVLSFVLLTFRLGKEWLFAYIAVVSVLINIFVMKGIVLFGLAVTGGNILYASIFLSTDLLHEHYGRAEAKKAVMIGFFASLFFLVSSQFILRFNPADYDIAQPAFETLFSLAPRVVIASLIAYLISQNLDVFLFEKIKAITGEKYLWLRNNGSTIISQLVDSLIFTTIAFAGIYPLWEMVVFTYIIKVTVAFLDTPFIYLSKIIKPKIV